MKKLTILLITAVFTLATSAFAGGMIGVKYGTGELDGNSKAYTAGSTTVAAQSGSKDNEFGAIFAEVNIKSSPISVGLEYVPFDADISLNGSTSGASANVSDYTTVYALAMQELTNFSVYAKLGYSMADIGTVKPNDGQTTAITAGSDSLEGMMYGVGVQSKELPFGLVARAEYTYTEFDDISVTTTSNGSASTSFYLQLIPYVTSLSISLHSEFFNERKIFNRIYKCSQHPLVQSQDCVFNVIIMNEPNTRISLYEEFCVKHNIYYTVQNIKSNQPVKLQQPKHKTEYNFQ